MTIILFCTCLHAWQDKRYGQHRRVHNQTEKSQGAIYRCTVCGKENSAK